MGKATFTQDEFWARLEEAGEQAVRIDFERGAYGSSGDRFALVQEWLSSKEAARSSARIRAQERRANIANAIAIAALAIAAISIIISLI